MRSLVYVAIVSLVLGTGCEKKQIEPEVETKVIGHGGNGFQMFTNPYPSNTVVSIRRALEGAGADGVEVDVQLSKDGIPVLYHDMMLESQTSGTGCIPEMTWDELKDFKYRRDIGNEIYSDEKLTRLEDVFILFSKYQPKPELHLDLRLENTCGTAPVESEYLEVITSMISKYNAEKWVIIESGKKEFLEKLSSPESQYRLALDCGSPLKEADWLNSNQIESVVCGDGGISDEDLVFIKNSGIKLILFNVKTQSSVKSALSKRPYAVQTDNLELMQEYLRN